MRPKKTGSRSSTWSTPPTKVSRPGRILGNLRRHESKRFQIRADSIFQGAPFSAIHVPVQSSRLAIAAHRLPVQGPKMMITTQLSGCCIVMIPKGGAWSVAHLQPVGETGVALQNRLKEQGLQTYGANDYGQFHAMFFGVRKGRKWEFFVQTQDLDHNVVDARKLIF